MISSYKEGRLMQGAIGGLLRVGLDHLYIYEGPAGPPLDVDVPPTDLEGAELRQGQGFPITIEHGRWRTDGRKRNAMLKRAKKDFPDGPLWAVVVDGDELLLAGEYLRDRLQWILWQDELAAIEDPRAAPHARWPLRLVEQDGSLSLITARVFRADLVQSIDHSSSVITNAAGVQEGWGNYAEVSKLWIEGWLGAIDAGKMIAWPPLPAEPHLVHRSQLRHPLRRGLRMSEQEAAEFTRAQAAEANGAALDEETEQKLDDLYESTP